MSGRILIAVDITTNRVTLRAHLGDTRYAVSCAQTPAGVLDKIATEQPDLILLDAQFASGQGLSLCRQLKNHPTAQSIPIILLTAPEDVDTGLDGLRAGAEEFLVKPLDSVTLLARIRSLMRARSTQEAAERRRVTVEDLGFSEAPVSFERAARIAIVADTTDNAKAIAAPTKDTVRDPISLFDYDNVLAMPSNEAPDLFLIDAPKAHEGTALDLISELRSRPATRHAAIVLRHRPDAKTTPARALDLRANDVVCSTCQTKELALRLRLQVSRKFKADHLRASVDDGLRLAAVDSLTGLYNRRYAQRHLQRLKSLSESTERTFALMIADLDRFKSVNDRYGHGYGDQALIEVSRRLRDNVRDNDLVARFGGEEFLLAIADTDLGHAHRAAERLRRAVSSDPFCQPGYPAERLTISIGVALSTPETGPEDEVVQLIKAADTALYDAKSEGRNQVILAKSAA